MCKKYVRCLTECLLGNYLNGAVSWSGLFQGCDVDVFCNDMYETEVA